MNACLFVVILMVLGVQSRWVPGKVSITADNAYAVYAGNSKGLAYLGSKYATNDNEIFDQVEYYPVGPLGKNDPTPPKRGLYLNVDQAIYIVAWSDAADNQGLLANIIINGVQISSDNKLWQVYPTGYFHQPTASGQYPPALPGCTPTSTPPDRNVAFGADGTAPPCHTWVEQAIMQADMANAWQTPTRGDLNSAQSFYGRKVDKLPAASKWMWFNSSECESTLNTPFETPRPRCQHQEPLIFRIPVGAADDDDTACGPVIVGQNRFCTGQCPFRPDGTAPNCASVYDSHGNLKECECCEQCTVVNFANPLENYCTGYCENNLCLQCDPSAFGTDPAGNKFIKECKCQPVGQSNICSIDPCNNICVGGCPFTNVHCTPKFSTSGQLIDCYCPNTTSTCQMAATAATCIGTCNTAGNPCKGVFANGILRECTCDCCDLLRDPVNPGNNRCIGKCDNLQTEKCQASSTVIIPWQGQNITVITGCDCKA